MRNRMKCLVIATVVPLAGVLGAAGVTQPGGKAPSTTPTTATNVTIDESPVPDTRDETTTPATLAPILHTLSQQWTFQAVLTDGGGVPFPGPTVDLSFQLYSAIGVQSSIGAPIVVNDVPIVNGFVSVAIPLSPLNFAGSPRLIGVSVDGGAELTPRTPIGAVPYAFRAHRVASEELDDAIFLGAVGQQGYLHIFSNGDGTITLDGDEPGGAGAIRMTNTVDEQTIEIDADEGGNGVIRVNQADGSLGVTLNGAGANGGGEVFLRNGAEVTTVELDADENGRGVVRVHQADGGIGITLDGEESDGGGQILVRNGQNVQTVEIDADVSDRGVIRLSGPAGELGVTLDGSQADGSGGGRIIVRNDQEIATLDIDADIDDRGVIRVSSATGQLGVTLDGEQTDGGGGGVTVRNSSGSARIRLEGDNNGEGHGFFDRIGVGTSNIPRNTRVAIGGTLRCEEVVVQLEVDWPDYVFAPDYNLMPLDKLEGHLEQARHLPGIPAANEVKASGISVGEMQAKTIEKVEELTLYVIQLNNELESIRAEKNHLQQRLANLETGRSNADREME